MCVMAATVHARQDPSPVREVVERFLTIQTKGLPGDASFSVGTIVQNNNLAPCPALEASMPASSRAWGKTTVQVRCQAEAAWSLYVPVQIRVMGEYLVAAHPLIQGQVVSQQDLQRRIGDLAELPSGILTDPGHAVGKTVAIGITAGRPLRSDMLRQPLAIRQGQSVKLVSRGTGFHVTTEGRALNSASDGQVVQARVASGQTLSGIARSGGIIDISP
jgi:flagella basal body P-ring formation protein FlgA